MHKTLQSLLWSGDIDLSMLDYARAILERKIKGCWEVARKAAYKQAFQSQLFAGDGHISTDTEWLFSYSSTHYPIGNYTGNKKFKNHYYRHIADRKNDEAEYT